MRQQLVTALASALAVGAVGAGAAIAQDYGHDHGNTNAPAKSAPAKKAQQKTPKGLSPSERQRWRKLQQLQPSRVSWAAYLTGEGEVSKQTGETDAGDVDGKGSAIFQVVADNTICYGFTLNGVAAPDAPTFVHIHGGKPGENGPVRLTFANGPKNAAGAPGGAPGASSGCKTVTDPGELAALTRIRQALRSKNPNAPQYYVNMHSKNFPDGAVRGQLSALYFDARKEAGE